MSARKCSGCSKFFSVKLSACPDCGAAYALPSMRGSSAIITPAKPNIPCCFDGCMNSANVRLFTKTGWVNVCARVHPSETGVFHYEQVETVPRVTHNPYLDEIRASVKKKRNQRETLRIPGADDE